MLEPHLGKDTGSVYAVQGLPLLDLPSVMHRCFSVHGDTYPSAKLTVWTVAHSACRSVVLLLLLLLHSPTASCLDAQDGTAAADGGHACRSCGVFGQFAPRPLTFTLPPRRELLLVHANYDKKMLAGHLDPENFTSAGFTFLTPKDVRARPGRIKGKYVVVKFDFEEPNGFTALWEMPERDHAAWVRARDAPVDVIFTLCPYTAAWANAFLEAPVRLPMFYPVNLRMFGPPLTPAEKVCRCSGVEHQNGGVRGPGAVNGGSEGAWGCERGE